MKTRDEALDFMKIVLVLQMIMAHIIQFFPSGKIVALYSSYVNLVTFSGFIFVFGYVGYEAYFANDGIKVKRLIMHAIKTIIAFYITGIAYILLIDKECSYQSLYEVFIFKRIPGYSEFLLTFAFIYPFIILLKCILRLVRIKLTGLVTILIVMISLGLTFINYHIVTNNIIGTFIGTYNYYSYPFFQYLSYYVLGMYLSKWKINYNSFVMAGTVLGAGLFSSYYLKNGSLPQRCPPSMYWIVGGWFIVYCYYLISRFICAQSFFRLHKNIKLIGKNTLVFLVMSNISIFVARYCFDIWHERILFFGGNANTALVYAALFVICLASSYTVIALKQSVTKMIVKGSKNSNNAIKSSGTLYSEHWR